MRQPALRSPQECETDASRPPPIRNTLSGVVVTELAEGTDAKHLGELIGFFGIPNAGLILIIVGLVRRSHEVAAKGDGSADCPDGKLDDSKYAFLRKGTTTLCLMLNLKQDHCYTATGTADNTSFAPAGCAGAGPRIKVVKRDDDSSDVARRPTGTRAFSYPHPTRLYCLERLAN
jgi:hypothetical protein